MAGEPSPTSGAPAGVSARAADKVVYDLAIEGLYLKGLAGRVTPGLKAKLKAAGLDLDTKLRATYPRELWVRCLELTTRELYPRLPTEEAFRLLGHAVFEGTANTVIGKTILSMAKLVGPRRAFGRLPQAFKSMNNFVEARPAERSEKEHELWLSDCYGHPSYMKGGLEAALAATGAKGLVVEQVALEGDSVTFRVKWQ